MVNDLILSENSEWQEILMEFYNGKSVRSGSWEMKLTGKEGQENKKIKYDPHSSLKEIAPSEGGGALSNWEK